MELNSQKLTAFFWKYKKYSFTGVSESVRSLKCSLTVCIFNKLPGDADAASPKTKLCKSHCFKQMSRPTWELSNLQYLSDSLFFYSKTVNQFNVIEISST